MSDKVKNELLELAKETIKLFRKAEDRRLFGFSHKDEWLRIQNKACLKAMDFEYKYARSVEEEG